MSEPTYFAALEAALDIFGTQSALAEAIGLKQQSVNDVFRGRRPAPAKWCIPLEKAIAEKVEKEGAGAPITRHQLRPDIYPPHEDASAA